MTVIFFSLGMRQENLSLVNFITICLKKLLHRLDLTPTPLKYESV